ncbi:zinc finger protein CONSTANS-LIKE 16-like [Telopea speciosissima]|uniref:zinc finger protein CONSTANS-LIKE 16-like n=1 Tax=Telopea speciosissima TaxID=54955 RepID=UPI001CC77DE0|nr:zinc finger protein CONSTANS-LIKE 16-like [Telopea speciosissima]
MSSDRKVASAIGGKTARACDSCVRKRARWYCAADDAFLCQGCDASVHSANSLARRHERVRLKTASLRPPNEDDNSSSFQNSLPSWHQGFTRKARTPRNAKSTMKPPKTEESIPLNPLPLVPEMGSDEASPDENEEQLLYRVPVFDPFVAELCTSTASSEAAAPATTTSCTVSAVENESKASFPVAMDNLPEFLPSDMDLAEFAADVESLLGRGLDENSFCMEGLGLLSAKEEERNMDTTMVKVEEEEEDGDDVDTVIGCHVDPDIEMGRETLDLNFDYDSQTTGEEEEEEKFGGGAAADGCSGGSAMMMKINGGYNLKLDYEAVIAVWVGQGQGSPWTTGDRPQLNLDDYWPDFQNSSSMDVHLHHHHHHHHNHIPYGGDMVRGGGGGGGGHVAMGDGGRQARVSRYREKRRTRLFSKKIRYEVRKLNAEKRPRMKGRFVKRTSFAGTGFTF